MIETFSSIDRATWPPPSSATQGLRFRGLALGIRRSHRRHREGWLTSRVSGEARAPHPVTHSHFLDSTSRTSLSAMEVIRRPLARADRRRERGGDQARLLGSLESAPHADLVDPSGQRHAGAEDDLRGQGGCQRQIGLQGLAPFNREPGSGWPCLTCRMIFRRRAPRSSRKRHKRSLNATCSRHLACTLTGREV